jgi:hypothetical protein
VARLLWHVAPSDLAAAQAWAAQQGGPTPAIEARPSPEGPSPLRITTAPATPVSLRLGDVLHALAGETAPSPGDPGQPAASLQLVPGAPASFLLLRPDPSTPDLPAATLERVFLDGLELPLPASSRPSRR